MTGMSMNSQLLFVLYSGTIVLVFIVLPLCLAAYFNYRSFRKMRDELRAMGYADSEIERLSGHYGGIEFFYIHAINRRNEND